jgi:hypothetical protein
MQRARLGRSKNGDRAAAHDAIALARIERLLVGVPAWPGREKESGPSG